MSNVRALFLLLETIVIENSPYGLVFSIPRVHRHSFPSKKDAHHRIAHPYKPEQGPVHICSQYRYPVHLFSEQVLGTHAFRLRDQWIFLRTIAFRFVIGMIRGLRSSMHYTAQPENLSPNDWQGWPWVMMRARRRCVLSPLPVEHVLSTIAFRLRFWRHTKGAICSENMVWPCSSWNCSSGNTTL